MIESMIAGFICVELMAKGLQPLSHVRYCEDSERNISCYIYETAIFEGAGISCIPNTQLKKESK